MFADNFDRHLLALDVSFYVTAVRSRLLVVEGLSIGPEASVVFSWAPSLAVGFVDAAPAATAAAAGARRLKDQSEGHHSGVSRIQPETPHQRHRPALSPLAQILIVGAF